MALPVFHGGVWIAAVSAQAQDRSRSAVPVALASSLGTLGLPAKPGDACIVFSISSFGRCLESMVPTGHLLSTRLNGFCLSCLPDSVLSFSEWGNHLSGKRFNFGFSSLHLTSYTIWRDFERDFIRIRVSFFLGKGCLRAFYSFISHGYLETFCVYSNKNELFIAFLKKDC